MEIERVQVELDRLEGRLRYLDNRVELGTITVYLQEPAPLGGEAGHDFITVINNGVAGLLATIDVVIIGFFTLLPLIVLVGIGYGTYRWRMRRRSDTSSTRPMEGPERR